MEELSRWGSRRSSRGADEREEKGGAKGMWQKKVAAAEIVGGTKKMENKYEKEEDIFLWERYFFREKIFF